MGFELGSGVASRSRAMEGRIGFGFGFGFSLIISELWRSRIRGGGTICEGMGLKSRSSGSERVNFGISRGRVGGER